MIKSLVVALAFLFGTWAQAAPDKPLVVMYWATYCSYCKQEIPILKKLVREGKIRAIGVVLDPQSMAKVRLILERYKPNFNLNGKYKAPGKIYGVPTIFIIKNGKVVKVFNRSTAPGEIEKYL